MQDDAADELHAVGAHSKHAVGCLAADGEGLGQQRVKRLSVLVALLEFVRFGAELVVGQVLESRTDGVDFIYNGLNFLEVALRLVAENLA